MSSDEGADEGIGDCVRLENGMNSDKSLGLVATLEGSTDVFDFLIVKAVPVFGRFAAKNTAATAAHCLSGRLCIFAILFVLSLIAIEKLHVVSVVSNDYNNGVALT